MTTQTDSTEQTTTNNDLGETKVTDPSQNGQGEAAEQGQEVPEQGGDGQDGSEGRSASREAARYRRALRDAETERDGLRERVERMQRAEVERLAGGKLAVPSDLWRYDVALAEMLDDDGDVDEGKVRAAVEALAESRPQLGHRKPTDFGQGSRGAARQASWSELIRNRR